MGKEGKKSDKENDLCKREEGKEKVKKRFHPGHGAEAFQGCLRIFFDLFLKEGRLKQRTFS